MRASVFESLTFICPVCRQSGHQSQLELAEVAAQDAGFVLEGLIQCRGCHAQFPIAKGVPVILRDLDTWWHGQRRFLTQADVGSSLLAGFFGELDRRNQVLTPGWANVSTYLLAHYASDHGNNRFWKQTCGVLQSGATEKPALDLGCAVGRMTFELAALAPVSVGVDLDFRYVAAANELLRTGSITYDRIASPKRLEREHLSYAAPANTLFIVADALDPPFAAETFGTVSALNLLDIVSVPLTLLGQMDALLAPGGRLLMSSPYQWQSVAVEPAQWLETDSVPADQFLRSVLCDGPVSSLNLNYTIESEDRKLNWMLVQNERQTRHFEVDLLVARKD